MPQPKDRIGDDANNITHTGIENRSDEQLIETTHQTDDNKTWSRYLAHKTSITPISSRMYNMGYAFSAVPFGLGIAITLYLFGLYLRWKVRGTTKPVSQ